MRVVAILVVVCVVFSVSDEFCFHRELLNYLLLPTPLVLLTGLASFYKASLKSSLLHQTLLNNRTSMYLAIIKTRLHQTLIVVSSNIYVPCHYQVGPEEVLVLAKKIQGMLRPCCSC